MANNHDRNNTILYYIELIGGGACSKIYSNKCSRQFGGGKDGGDGHGFGLYGVWQENHGNGTGVSLDHFSMQFFHLTPGDGGTQDEGLDGLSVQVMGGGGGGVLVDGDGPDREATCQGEGYGGGGGAMTTGSMFKFNNFLGHLGLPGVILVEVY